MTRRYLRILLVGSLLSLTACAPQSEVRQMHQSISTLNKEMTQLNQETVKITQQIS
ncbi:lipoprotein [Salmonella enterica subsp. enterica serovar Typhimurium]|nr:lipoprotein [Salmonella enterica subsp. enterica serovar Typhimurium]